LKLIDVIGGARPNFVKIASIMSAIRNHSSDLIAVRLIHTGQHYDPKLSHTFFEQLNIEEPDINLGVGSGTQAQQTALIMMRYEELIIKEPSDACIVVGDVNSTMACATTAKKLGLKVGHVEAGIRSGDRQMPEEINRLITDSISDLFFTTTRLANENLLLEGTRKQDIYFVGNTMIDTLLANLDRLYPPAFWDDLNLHTKCYFVLTLHRPSNVDDSVKLNSILHTVADATRGLPVIFPAHPRTLKIMREVKRLPRNIHIVAPQTYLEFNFLVKNSKAVITDSGGITEEATVLGVPCMTLRNSTERPETVDIGTNELLGSDPSALYDAMEVLFSDAWKHGQIPELWDGKAGERIINHLYSALGI